MLADSNKSQNLQQSCTYRCTRFILSRTLHSCQSFPEEHKSSMDAEEATVTIAVFAVFAVPFLYPKGSPEPLSTCSLLILCIFDVKKDLRIICKFLY